MGGLGVVLGDLGAILGGLGAVFGRPWGVLGCSWGVLEHLGAALGSSWGPLGRSKIDQKSDPKIDPKSSRIRIGPKRSGATPVDVSEVDQPQRNSLAITKKNYLNR